MLEALLPDLLLLFVAALAGGWIASRLRLPLVLGYVTAGIAIGPYTSGPTIAQLPLVETLAQVGVALMLFSRGLQVSLKDMAPMRTFAWLGTFLQMLLTTAYGTAIALFLGWPWLAAFWFGAILSLSGIIITRRALAQAQLAESQAATLAIAVLTVQNLLVIPLVLVIERVALGHERYLDIVVALLWGLFLLAILLLLSTQIVGRMVPYLRFISPEVRGHVVLICTILVIMALYWAGLPLVFGAFAVGLTLGESKVLDPLLHSLVSWQSLFGALFFVSVGVLLDLPLILANLGVILLLVVLVMAGKGLLLALLVRLFGYGARTSLMVGFMLWQISELALIISQLGAEMGVLDTTLYNLTIAVVLLTLLVTPLVWFVTTRYLREMPLPA